MILENCSAPYTLNIVVCDVSLSHSLLSLQLRPNNCFTMIRFNFLLNMNARYFSMKTALYKRQNVFGNCWRTTRQQHVCRKLGKFKTPSGYFRPSIRTYWITEKFQSPLLMSSAHNGLFVLCSMQSSSRSGVWHISNTSQTLRFRLAWQRHSRLISIFIIRFWWRTSGKWLPC